ncbi:MAG: preprotein translocase subunit SecA [Candidatus Endonucleobacter sp. (ex Gigantidas childressi)]|nr:preprotein translocase subunit SecA [Candidatus Endonucleobacter sp. (ex Gigantidas childressi)]
MFASLIKKIIGSRNDRQLKRMEKLVKAINTLESGLSDLSDDELKAKTGEFRERFSSGDSLNALLVEAFAVVREASKRVLSMRHFDVQLIGGIVLHEGCIAEMRTGEGKTLVATLPAYLNAISGEGVHVVTVNDYLARRDANWMMPLYHFLGMEVGVVVPQQNPDDKHVAYSADITYGTNNEFGFDFLRDNMAFCLEDKFQRKLCFAVIDEVDSILIDEARTPLVISGPAEDSSELYREMNRLVPHLKMQEEEEKAGELVVVVPGHYTVDEKSRQVELTEDGHKYIEESLQRDGKLPEGESLYSSHNLNLLHHVTAALKSHVLFTRNVEYIVQGGDIMLIDEHTGRTMPGRRLSDGLHQALEAKENLDIQSESQTLASTTFQNYFRNYKTLSGMTGTADTEAFEFRQIYNLDVVVIPTHKPMVRKDFNDLIYLSIEEKYDAIIQDIKDTVASRRPVLVGTASIASSERLSVALNKAGLNHQVLNAKFHEKEAEIISQAGRPGSITLATNMAGRGTDISLGGNWEAEVEKLVNPSEEDIRKARLVWQATHEEVLEAGGLHIIATERHESRRIDNQLRGRSGRQGDPGSSRFYLSLEDNLMRIFASGRVKNFMKALGMEKGEAIEHRMVSNAIEKAQRKVEGRNFDIRKQLLEYDDVANDQRKVIYSQRDKLLMADEVFSSICALREDVIGNLVSQHIPPESQEEQWDVKGLEERIASELNQEMPIQTWLDQDDRLDEEALRQKIIDEVAAAYQKKEELTSSEMFRNFEKQILLRILDDKWKEHLATMDYLRQGIHLRGYAQKNPKQEYKCEAFALFQQMLEDIKHDTLRLLSHVQVEEDERIEEDERKRRADLAQHMEFQHEKVIGVESKEKENLEEEVLRPFVRKGRKIGRNEPCSCGSGKKYKHCHGKIA